jgi:hypothetical protein
VRTTSTESPRIGEPRQRFISRIAITGWLTLVLVGLFGAGFISGTIAQEGTPEGSGVEGAVFEPLAFGSVSTLPAAPASFQLVRVRIPPGGNISIPADDPGLVLIYVESGTMTSTATTSTSVLRAALLATPEAQPFEEVAAGAEFTVGPGDSFVGLPNSGGEFRNDGAEEVVLLIAGLLAEAAGTPTT